MANTSATGGPLVPAAAPAPLEGRGLNDFLQAWIVGITGLPGRLVRPAWQAEPPNIPDAGTAWCAFAVTIEGADTYPFVGLEQDGLSSTLQRHEVLALLCSFYDLGESGLAQGLAAQMRDGTAIPQNLEYLLAQGMGLIGCEPTVFLPPLFKERWMMRVDVAVRLRRQVDRTYPVLSVLSGQIELNTDVSLPPREITVTNQGA